MNIIIIEDELSASNRIKKMLQEIDPMMEVLGVLESVEDAINWLKNNKEPDIIIADIQLSDGLSFEIFDGVNVESTVIFTTAYDEYAIEAFKVNSIDYLLKPIDIKELGKSIQKYRKLENKYSHTYRGNFESLLNQIKTGRSEYKSRFLVKSGQSFQTIPAEDIQYFFIQDQLVFIKTIHDKKYIVESSLDDLEKRVNPNTFFRINRQMIISINSIESIHQYFNSRLMLRLKLPFPGEVIVSRLKVGDFKSWLDR